MHDAIRGIFWSFITNLPYSATDYKDLNCSCVELEEAMGNYATANKNYMAKWFGQYGECMGAIHYTYIYNQQLL